MKSGIRATDDAGNRRARSALTPWVLRIAKSIIFVLVVWGVWRAVQNARQDFVDQGVGWSGLRYGWLCLAGCLYALGMLPMGCFWYYLLHRWGQAPRWYETLRAFYIGHLGKYVPGKVMVVVIRTGLIRSHRVDTTVAAVSVFVETLTMMASGAFLAAVLLAIWLRHQWRLQLLAVLLMAATLLVTFPPILRAVLRRLKRSESPERLGTILANVSWSTVAVGWGASFLGWCLIALSLGATLKALPLAGDVTLGGATFVRWVSSVTLAVVAGFLSLLPGGLLVREWVFTQLLAPAHGAAAALVAAILLRLVWLLTELLISIILYFTVPSTPT